MRNHAHTMNPTAADVLAMTCTTVKTPTGWLALSRPFAPLRIGVVGDTKAGAQAAFAESIKAWARLREMPDPFNR